MKLPGNDNGFTMIEVVVTLLLIGILAAVVIMRAPDTSDVNLAAQGEAVKSHIRYTQMRAMNSDPVNQGSVCRAPFGLKSGGTSYFLFSGCDDTTRFVLPGSEADIVTLPAGLTLTSGTVSFDEWGRPYNLKDVNNSSTSATLNWALSDGSGSVPITIEQNTGFVQ